MHTRWTLPNRAKRLVEGGSGGNQSLRDDGKRPHGRWTLCNRAKRLVEGGSGGNQSLPVPVESDPGGFQNFGVFLSKSSKNNDFFPLFSTCIFGYF